MKLIKDKKFLKNIAQYIDVANTVGGGVSQPLVRVKNKKDGSVIKVSLPGITPSQCQVVLDKNRLTLMALLQSDYNSAMQVPLFLHHVVLPPYVDFAQIHVAHQDGELQVTIPNLPQGPRFLDIEER
ncbi:MAG: Hsp20/alpha crystallin family protein [Rufibacter sp.]